MMATRKPDTLDKVEIFLAKRDGIDKVGLQGASEENEGESSGLDIHYTNSILYQTQHCLLLIN